MAEQIGQLLGQLPGWLLFPALLVIVIALIEYTLAQTGDSLTDIWKGRKSGKK